MIPIDGLASGGDDKFTMVKQTKIVAQCICRHVWGYGRMQPDLINHAVVENIIPDRLH